jgi:hypothetical protein
VALSCGFFSGLLLIVPLLAESVYLGHPIPIGRALSIWMIVGSIFGTVSIASKLRPKERVTFHLNRDASFLIVVARSVTFSLSFICLYFHTVYLPPLAVACALLAMAGYMLIQLYTADAPAARSRANQGTAGSAQTAIFVALLTAPLWICLGWIMNGLSGAITLATSASVCVGLLTGGLFCIKHYTLRFVLWVLRSGPLQFAEFLEHATSRTLLFRVGGGYIFIHNLLQEYLAGLRGTVAEKPNLETRSDG